MERQAACPDVAFFPYYLQRESLVFTEQAIMLASRFA
jgi:hypothetical protein